MACDKYSRPTGVMGGPCLTCGASQPEHDTDPSPKLCTTSGESVEKVRAEQTEVTGQHKGYIVLCPDERAKGFVRPYRDAYQHAGQSRCRDCGATQGSTTCNASGFACIMERHGGCNTVTTMGRALSETYARDPKFYGATFCCNCNRHLPVAEFVWTADRQQVGS